MKTKTPGPQCYLPFTSGSLSNLLKRKALFFQILLLSVLLTSCNQENQFDPSVSNTAGSPILFRDPSDPPLMPGEPILGDELQNPYDINNMESAYAILTGSTIQYSPTHYYIKFLPVNGEDIIEIESFEEDYGYEFETQPIHFQVLAEGMEDYVDPVVGDQGFSPEYGAVTQADFSGGHFPDVPYVVLNEMYMPLFETRLTFTAFVISGNEEYYEAIDGLCHPDCPSWPHCLDDPSLTCQVDPNVGYIPSIDPMTTQPKENFPGYILDENLGYHGEIIESSSRIAIIPNDLDCPEGCIPILEVAPISLGGWFWDCDCSDDWEDDGGLGGPPPGQVTRCGCFVYDDKRMPGGKISVEDTRIDDEGIRRIKMKTAPKNFGFIWKNTDTDDEGCWKIDHRYNVKRLKVKAVFKDRVSNRMVIRSLRGVRFWNAFLKPVKHKFIEKKDNKEWHSLCQLIEDSDDNSSRDEQSYVAGTTNNAVHEYYDDYSTMPSPGKIRIMIHNLDDRLDAAPMFNLLELDINPLFTELEVSGWFVAFGILFPVFPGYVENFWEASKPDVFISFGLTEDTDQKKSTVYHEMTHVSQYAVAGPEWWEEYVRYIIGVSTTDQPTPYGDGSSEGSGRAELAEGMAYSYGHVMADYEYGLDHSNGTPLQFFRFINIIEREVFQESPTQFIPSGLFFDLFDQNNVFPVGLSTFEANGITDNINGFPFESQLQAYENNLQDMGAFKLTLWMLSGGASGNSLNDYNQLFQSYGH